MQRLAVVLAIARLVSSNPFPQGVTATIAPKEAIPTGCGGNWNGMPFGIAAEPMPVSNRQMFSSGSPAMASSVSSVAAVSDADMPMITPMGLGPMNAPGASVKMAAVAGKGTSNTDTTVTVRSTRTHTRTLTVRPVSTKAAVSSVPGGKIVRVGIISQIEDGQIQAPPTATPILVPTPVDPPADPADPGNPGYGMSMAKPTGPKQTLIVTQISDGQIQAPKPAAPAYPTKPAAPAYSPKPGAPAYSPKPGAPMPGASEPGASEPDAPEPGYSFPGLDRRQINDSPATVEMGLGCKKPGGDSLTLTLKNGVLKDNHGRTGYIADNRQFQFDDPPQFGSIFTAGFSVCGDGYLALGGSKQFWQCRSGDFYNLYDKWIAAQCEPIHIRTLNLTESACR